MGPIFNNVVDCNSFLTRFQFPFVVVKSKRWIAREGGGLHALHIGSTLQEIFTITTGSSNYNSFWFSARYCLGTKHFTFLKGPTKGFRTILSSPSSSSPFISHLLGRGDFQETTRLIGEATSVVNMFVIKLWICGLANSDSFYLKNSMIFLLKVKKLVKPVIDIAREFQILGLQLVEYCKLFKISTTVMWSIAIGYSCNKLRNIGGNSWLW